MARLFARYPDAIARTLEIAERCRFSLDELRYEYPDDPVPDGRTPQQELVRLAWEGAAERYPEGVPDKVRAQVEHELDADRAARLRPLLPHRARHRPLRPRPRHPLPGPRLGRQLRRLLLPRHHRRRSRPFRPALRALRQRRAQRAARHRRRLRARAPRGGDPVRLRQVRPRPRGHDRDRHLLPRRRWRCARWRRRSACPTTPSPRCRACSGAATGTR